MNILVLFLFLIAPAQTEAAKRTHLGVPASLDRGSETSLDLWTLDGVAPGGTAERQDRVGLEIMLGHQVIDHGRELCIALRAHLTGPVQGLHRFGRIRTFLDDGHGAATEVGDRLEVAIEGLLLFGLGRPRLSPTLQFIPGCLLLLLERSKSLLRLLIRRRGERGGNQNRQHPYRASHEPHRGILSNV